MNSNLLIKVPQVTVSFWIIKILATTLGETGGDTLSMSLGLGYLLSTLILGFVFLLLVTWQIKTRYFSPCIYWLTIIATTTVGTTLADFADRSLGIGYAGGSALLASLLAVALLSWHFSVGSIAVAGVNNPKTEIFYWVTIMLSQTLGTALGDWVADTQGLGFAYSIGIFGGLLAVVALAYAVTQLSRTLLFWLAFILTRPLGAVVGDFIDKPLNEGGLAMSHAAASATLLALILASLMIFRQQPAKVIH